MIHCIILRALLFPLGGLPFGITKIAYFHYYSEIISSINFLLIINFLNGTFYSYLLQAKMSLRSVGLIDLRGDSHYGSRTTEINQAPRGIIRKLLYRSCRVSCPFIPLRSFFTPTDFARPDRQLHETRAIITKRYDCEHMKVNIRYICG